MSAAGKTQLCLQLSLTVQLPCQMGGLEAGGLSGEWSSFGHMGYIIAVSYRLKVLCDSICGKYDHMG